MNKKNEKYIDNLVDDLTPIRLNWSAEKRSIFFVIINFFVITALMLFIGPLRAELSSDFVNLSYTFESLWFLMCIVCMSYFYFLSLVPGAIKIKNLKWSLILYIILIAIFLYKTFFSNHIETVQVHRSFCYLEVFILSIIPMGQLFYFTKKSNYSHYSWSYTLACLSASLIPALIMHFMCKTDYQHILSFHMLPSFMSSTLGILLFIKTDS